MGKLSLRIDDYPGTKPAEFVKHNFQSFREFHQILAERDLPYVLGVIPRYVGLEDLRQLALLSPTNSCPELAIHGVDHDERYLNEFEWRRDRVTTKDAIKISLERELERFQEMALVRPTTYIPPHNVIDNQTLYALFELGFRRLMVGPGVESSFPDIQVLRTRCKFYELELVESYSPLHYGRSDELFAEGSIQEIVNDLKTKDVCLTLHWTWECNIGFDHLRLYLDRLRENMNAAHAAGF